MLARITNAVKTAYTNVRIGSVKPTGILATRLLMAVMLTPILFVVGIYVVACMQWLPSESSVKLINLGINIIDHIFIPSVLTALVGFLSLWIDKNHSDIPDYLEKER